MTLQKRNGNIMVKLDDFRLDKKPLMPYKVWEEKLRVRVRQWYKVYKENNRDAMKVRHSIEIFQGLAAMSIFYCLLISFSCKRFKNCRCNCNSDIR